MSYEYSAFVRYNDPDDPLRLKNLSETPTVTAYEGGDGDSIAGASIVNITTGIYKVKVTHSALEPVLFKVIPHNDDKDDFPDEALLAEEVRFIADDILADTGDIKHKLSSLIDPNSFLVSGSSYENVNGMYRKIDDYHYVKDNMAIDRVSGVWRIYNPGPGGAHNIYYSATSDVETPDLVDNWQETGGGGEVPIVSIVSAVKLGDEQGEITWGQQKIIADVEGEGALHIQNLNASGVGQWNFGMYTGLHNEGAINGQRNLGSTKVSGYDPAIAKEATLTAIKGAGWTNETLKAIKDATGGGGLDAAGVRSAVGLASANLDTQLGNIKTDTGNVSTRLTATRAGYLDKLNVSGTLANTDNAGTFKADVSGLAKTTDLSGLAEKTDIPNDYAKASALTTVDGKADAIKAQTDKIPATPAPANEYDARLLTIQSDLDNPDQYKADISALATSAEVGALNNITAAEVLAEEVIGGYSLAQVLTALAAKMHGLASGAGTTTIAYDGIDGTPNVVVETVDGKGNRSNVVLNI